MFEKLTDSTLAHCSVGALSLHLGARSQSRLLCLAACLAILIHGIQICPLEHSDLVLELGVHLLHFDLLVSLFVEPVSPRGLVNWHTIVIANLKDSLSLLYTLSFSIDAGCG